MSINKSRHLSVDNDHPKTTHSERAITISRELMDLIQALRHPWTKDADKVFTNKVGTPIISDSFRVDYWDRVLKSFGILKKKFYSPAYIHNSVRPGGIQPKRR